MMKESIKRLKEKLDQSSTGHLPLSLRVDLMKQIGDILSVQKSCASAVRKPVLSSDVRIRTMCSCFPG